MFNVNQHTIVGVWLENVRRKKHLTQCVRPI
jgi:hypothetical protein